MRLATSSSARTLAASMDFLISSTRRSLASIRAVLSMTSDSTAPNLFTAESNSSWAIRSDSTREDLAYVFRFSA
jgi:hypothetical protein